MIRSRNFGRGFQFGDKSTVLMTPSRTDPNLLHRSFANAAAGKMRHF